MPEAPEINGFVEIVSAQKGVYNGEPEVLNSEMSTSQKSVHDTTEYALHIHIITHSAASHRSFEDGKKSTRAYTTMTVDRKNYSGPDCLEPGTKNTLSVHCIKRLEQMPWLAYLLNPSQPGQLYCAKRGKLMVIGAGNHAAVFHFGLEAHILGMPRSVYNEIIQNDIPGPNEDPEQAEMVRSFVIPPRFSVPNSSPNDIRTINILAAFVSPKWAWTFVDFVRLGRVHIISRDEVYMASDFVPTSSLWPFLFQFFKGGPDWFLERPLAEDNLDTWRRHVIAEYQAYQDRYKSWNRKVTPPATHAISDYFPGKQKYEVVIDKTHPPQLFNRPILTDMAKNAHGAFSGYGRHCINDVLYHAAIFPGTPSHIICRDSKLFHHLKEVLYTYISKYSGKPFLKKIVSIPNSKNPFNFNEKSNQDYLSSYIDVFRRCKVLVPVELYNEYIRQGLLDPNHVIGAPYVHDARKFCTKFKKWAPVTFFGITLKAYSIILAKPPPEWIGGDPVHVAKDIGRFSFATTIGCTQLRERNVNRTDIRLDNSSLSCVGRRPVEKTGRPGRPRKVGYTKNNLALMRSRQGRQANLPPPELPPKELLDDLSDDSDLEHEEEEPVTTNITSLDTPTATDIHNLDPTLTGLSIDCADTDVGGTCNNEGPAFTDHGSHNTETQSNKKRLSPKAINEHPNKRIKLTEAGNEPPKKTKLIKVPRLSAFSRRKGYTLQRALSYIKVHSGLSLILVKWEEVEVESE